jgi:hypothetical protein
MCCAWAFSSPVPWLPTVSSLLTQLRQLEVLVAAVLELDTVFRQRNSSPSLGARIAGAAHGVKAVLQHWPPKVEAAATESGHMAL